jgi:hypothetical protein
MLKKLFTRAEFTDLTGIRHQTTYQLEKKNIINPANGEYTFNQVIFGRFLEQSRLAYSSPTIKFADGFRGRSQYEIEWEKVELVFLTKQGAGMIQGDDLPIGIRDLTDEWLLPLEKEAFLVSGSDVRVKDFFAQNFRFMLTDNSDIVIAVVGRIRQRLLEEIDVRGLENKIKSPEARRQLASIKSA